MDYYYTYVLKSNKDNKLYYGRTKNLKLRIEQHNKGMVKSTKYRRNLELIYFEGSVNKDDSQNREKYFKTYYGRMFEKKRLTNYFKNNSYSTG